MRAPAPAAVAFRAARRRSLYALAALVTGLCLLIGAETTAGTLRLAVTTSFHNSGIGTVLLPAIRQDLGIDIHLLIVGTGQALGLARNGDVDAILVHAPQAEEDFVATGYGVRRCPIMHNDFVILGPQSDPAEVAKAPDARSALLQIAKVGGTFVSRGDNSGTHMRELELWHAASRDADAFGNWYKDVGAGMGAALNTASALDAYILTDRASWLTFGNPGTLTLLFGGDPALFNQYSFIRVNPDRHDHVKGDLTRALEDWLTSARASQLIDGYGIAGEPLFTSNPGCP